jgi:hypothetical protein
MARAVEEYNLAMGHAVRSYIASFQAEAFHRGRRHHWMICRAENADELVSWGHEPTRELAEAAAEKEVQVLSSGMTPGGQVTSKVKPFTRRIRCH